MCVGIKSSGMKSKELGEDLSLFLTGRGAREGAGGEVQRCSTHASSGGGGALAQPYHDNKEPFPIIHGPDP